VVRAGDLRTPAQHGHRAASLGQALGQEDGVANAVRVISAYLDAPGGKH
jgi:hypothetical protein